MTRALMSHGRTSSALRFSLIGCVAVGVAVAALQAPASAGAKRNKRERNLSVSVSTPLGLQGRVGVGDNSVLPFTVYERRGRNVTVQVEFGWDRDGDGVIADGSDPRRPSEYERTTQVRRDARDTSRLRAGRKGSVATYRAHRDGGRHGFVWSSAADLPGARIMAGRQVVRDATGRPVPDRADPSTSTFGDDQLGVRLRLRAITGGRHRTVTAWAFTESFSVDNSSAPVVRIDDVAAFGPAADRVAIDWTGFDDDSEDANGNRLLDVLALEDRNGNGRLDEAFLAVHVDFHALADDDPVPTSPLALADLKWSACTRSLTEGDADTGILVAPEPIGGSATFVWDSPYDLFPIRRVGERFLLRVTPYDDMGNLGRPAYVTTPVVIPIVE